MSPSAVITIGDYCSLDASDVIRLIQAHLTECGLHESCRTLQQESGILAAGTSFSSSSSSVGTTSLLSTTNTTTTTTGLKAEIRGATIWHTKAMEGDWGWILSQLSTLDVSKIQQHAQYQKLLSDTSEMVILELAEGGDIELAYATLRLWSTQLDCVEATISTTTTTTKLEDVLADKIPKSRQLEQILAALVASKEPSLDEKHSLLFGKRSKAERRDDIGRRLMQIIPVVPPSRLLTLLQQAIHWQIHTGQFPTIQQHWSEEEKLQQAQNIPTSSSLVSSPKMKRSGTKRVFDLVIGDVPRSRSSSLLSSDPFSTKSCALPRKVLSVISLGKRATAQAAVFLPDGSGLVVGSSDGLVEIWSTASRYQELKLDLPYQQNDEFLGHDDAKITAMTVSNDGTLLATGVSQGTIKIWRLDNGNCVRDIKAYSKDSSLLCLNFLQRHLIS
jgi:WD40 repeat protein